MASCYRLLAIARRARTPNVVRAMKIRLLPLSLFAVLLAAGCGKQKIAANSDHTAHAVTSGTPAATANPAVPAPAATTAPSATPAATGAGGKTVEIIANDQMKFSVTAIEAKVGEEVKVVLKNEGTLPKEAMGHNFVLLKKGTDVNAFATAAMTAKDTDYVPAAMKDKVIAHTPVLGPKKSAEVTFKLAEAGEYTFICSFPGHFMLMKGTVTVK